MTESDVDNLLQRSARRLRLERGVRAGLASLGIGLLLAAGTVLLSRLKGYDALLIGGLIVPPVLALAGLLAAYFRYQPALGRVALLLDRRSNSAEHLVTWHEYRARPERVHSEVQREFLDAQRKATLNHAAKLDPKKLIPLHWPEWSRVVLLAFLLLCCAWLTPRNDGQSAAVSSEESRARHGGPRGGAAASGDSAAPADEDLPTMELLSQTEQQKFKLIASDDRLTDAQKSEALKDLQAKLAGIPESQLTKLDRDVMKLRADAGKSDKPKDAASSADSSAQKTSSANDHETESTGSVRAAKIPDDPAKIFDTIRNQYPAELQHRLDHYYRGAEIGKQP